MDTIIPLRSKPSFNFDKRLSAPQSIRTYRASPEDVVVQIRLNNRYVTASLSLAQASMFGRAVLAARWEQEKEQASITEPA